MGGRASIVGAAETSVGKVRDHNEDSHFIDPQAGIFVVCDGMGGHAAGEVASALAVKVIREQWASEATQVVADTWSAGATPETRKLLIKTIQDGVIAAHDTIVAEAKADKQKSGMGTTLVGAMVVGGDIVFAQAGDSRAYMVRDGIAMQLTEDHTLLARLLAAGVDVDTSNEGARFKSMLTNALGIGHECKVSTFVVPVADGDRFLLCSDGITEYVEEAEIGEVLTTQPSPARSAQKLVELALQRGGGDNATALVVRVIEAGETARPAEQLHRDNKAINACPLWSKVSPQQRLRALRIALARDHAIGERIPAHTMGDRVAWILVEGDVDQDGIPRGPGELLYPQALLADAPLPDKAELAIPVTEVRALALRADDFREICEDDSELGEVLLEALGAEIAAHRPGARGRVVVQPTVDQTAPPSGGAAGRAQGPTVGQTAPPSGGAAGRAQGPTVGQTAPPSGGAAGRAQGPTVGQTAPPSGGAAGRAQGPPTVDARGATDPADLGRAVTDPNIKAVRVPTNDETAPTMPPATVLRPPAVAPEPRRPALPPIPRAPATPPSDAASNTGDDPGRGPTSPLAVAKTADKMLRLHPRGTTPPAERLIVPKADRADADAQLDRALLELTVDRTWADLPDDAGEATDLTPRIPSRPGTEEPEITMEAAEAKSEGDGDSEPEISIENLVEMESEGPLNDPHDEPTETITTMEDNSVRITKFVKDTPSQTMTLTVAEPTPPEVLVVKPGRAITADDTKLVAGSIETTEPAKRAKRQTDAPE